MTTNAPAVEYLATGRVGDGLVLIPELSRFHRLCDSIAKVLESHGATLAQLQASLPRVRKRVFARRYPRLVRKSSGKAKGRVRQA